MAIRLTANVPNSMVERFTPSARLALLAARARAQAAGERFIQSYHLLLTLVQLQPEKLEKVWCSAAVLEGLRRDLAELPGPTGSPPGVTELRLSPEAKRVLRKAIEAARIHSLPGASKHKKYWEVDSRHIFLGLLAVPECKAAKLLSNRSVTLEESRKRLFDNCAHEQTNSPPAT